MKYIVSFDNKSQCYYAHLDKCPNVPIFGSVNKNKKVALEYAKMRNGLKFNKNYIKE